jgi:hypothetical protein
MAQFDIGTFASITGNGGGAAAAVGGAFGVPDCLIDLASGALASLIPSPILAVIQLQIEQARAAARAAIKKIFKWLASITGIIEYDTESGTLQFKSISSLGAIDSGLEILGSIGAFIEAINVAVADAINIYNNIEGQIQDIVDCLQKFKDIQDFKKGPSASQGSPIVFEAEFDAAKLKFDAVNDYINKTTDAINNINSILAERKADPSLEPEFNDALADILEGTGFNIGSPEDPGLQDDTFRLVFGPPKSSDGQFLLSVDGLYYDAQSGGLDPVLVTIQKDIDPGDVWKYDFDPNLGGKGQQISLNSINKFVDNIFDPNLIDDSAPLQEHYDADHFLQVLNQQKSKHSQDLKGQITSLETEFGVDSSIVLNFKQSIISQISSHEEKINKRKKQIEIAVKVPAAYGGGTLAFEKGKVPINDFSFLEEYKLGVDLELQKSLVFDQADVVGIVLPVKPKFVKSSQKSESISFNHLTVPKVGKGQIIYTGSGTQDPIVLSLTDEIETDKLFAIYNFLETKTVLPSSTDFLLTNCATEDTYNNGKLVSTNSAKIFVSGLGIPYFEGVVNNKTSDTSAVESLGSFVKLPGTDEFRNLTYSPSGFSIDFWTHVPNITDGDQGWLSGTTSSLTKVILGCENIGAKSGVNQFDYQGDLKDLDYLANEKGDSFVRGMLMGFTRDRRITQDDTGFSNNNSLNDPVSSLSFFVAPTISRDLSSASWINSDDCQNTTNYFKLNVDLHSTDIGNVSSQFIHMNVSVEPEKDLVSVYCDGSLVTTSSMQSVFGSTDNRPPSLPTLAKENSFQYSSNTVVGPDTVKQGPLLDTVTAGEVQLKFTPWIVGGGFTDGNSLYGNFLGGDRGGITSGLRGHLGSLKFYSKPLDSSEVLKNYNAQKGFFKNIQI